MLNCFEDLKTSIYCLLDCLIMDHASPGCTERVKLPTRHGITPYSNKLYLDIHTVVKLYSKNFGFCMHNTLPYI